MFAFLYAPLIKNGLPKTDMEVYSLYLEYLLQIIFSIRIKSKASIENYQVMQDLENKLV